MSQGFEIFPRILPIPLTIKPGRHNIAGPRLIAIEPFRGTFVSMSRSNPLNCQKLLTLLQATYPTKGGRGGVGEKGEGYT